MAPFHPLRPPGALPEKEFLGRCIQCGRCAQVCPHLSVRLGWSLDLVTMGTPMVRPRQTPCYLCMRCPPVCPTGALAPIAAREEAGMGLAVIDRKRCWTYEGSVFCKTCHEKCPLHGTALIMDMGLYPVVTDKCVGCGVCENVCPAQAIVTLAAADLPAGKKGKGAA